MVKFGARLRDELRHVGWEAHYVRKFIKLPSAALLPFALYLT